MINLICSYGSRKITEHTLLYISALSLKCHIYDTLAYHFLIHPTPPNFQNSGCQVVNDEFHYHLTPAFLSDVNGRSSER